MRDTIQRTSRERYSLSPFLSLMSEGKALLHIYLVRSIDTDRYSEEYEIYRFRHGVC